MLNQKQRQITAAELWKNYELLNAGRDQVLEDLCFTEEQLDHALHVTGHTNGYDVWKLRDYLLVKLKEQEKEAVPFSILIQNIWYPYHKTWQ